MNETPPTRPAKFKWSDIPGWLQALTGVIGGIAALVAALTAAGFFQSEDPETSERVHVLHPRVDFKYRAVPYVGNVFIRVRAQASEDSAQVGTLPSNGIVRAGDEVNGWRPVKLFNGSEGWVHSKAVTIVQERGASAI